MIRAVPPPLRWDDINAPNVDVALNCIALEYSKPCCYIPDRLPRAPAEMEPHDGAWSNRTIPMASQVSMSAHISTSRYPHISQHQVFIMHRTRTGTCGTPQGQDWPAIQVRSPLSPQSPTSIL